jgi:hypothetical protein
MLRLRKAPLNLPEKAIEVLEQDGGVIITGLASPEQLQQVYQDVRQVMESRMSDEASHLGR